VRPMGRVSAGVKGIELRGDDEVVDMVVLSEEGSLLTLSENGFGKRTDLGEYPRIHRGGKGVIDIKTTDRNGRVVACKQVADGDEVMVVTGNGIMIRIPVEGISRISRNTQGVRCINLDEGDRVIDMTRVAQSSDVGGDESSGGEGSSNGEDSGNGQAAADSTGEESAEGN